MTLPSLLRSHVTEIFNMINNVASIQALLFSSQQRARCAMLARPRPSGPLNLQGIWIGSCIQIVPQPKNAFRYSPFNSVPSHHLLWRGGALHLNSGQGDAI